MGPPIYIGGNAGPHTIRVRVIKLQWGHRFISVETTKNLILDPLFRGASMGPPIYIGGNF